MSTALADIFDFIKQQIELYGDEFAIAKTVSAKNSDDNGNVAPDWPDASSLDELEQKINQCTRCDLHKSRKNLVFGSGNASAKLVLVGEAPGAEEDRLGKPFVGRAGELLTKMLAAIQLERSDVYICNIIKSRPPQNRDPLKEEIQACLPYLKKQLELIQPKIILCLGRIAAQTLLDTSSSLSSLRNQWHDYDGKQLRVTYHPAALLRNPQHKKDAWEDLKQVKQNL